MKEKRKIDLITYSSAIITGIIATLLLLPVSLINIPSLKPGEISPVDIRSPVSITVINREKTQKLKEKAREKVIPIFRTNPSAEQRTLNQIEKLSYLSKKQKEDLKKLLKSYYRRGIVSEIPKGFNRIKLISSGREKIVPVSRLITEKQIKNQFQEDLQAFLQGNETAQKVFHDIKVEPNIVFEKEETKKLWKEAESKVKPVYMHLKKGELVVKRGERVSPEVAEKLKLLREKYFRSKTLHKYLSLFILSLTLYLSVVRLYRILSPSAFELKNVLFSFTVITLDIFFIKIFTFLSKLTVETLNLPVKENLIYVPVVTSVIFASMFVNKKVAIIHIFPVALLSGFILSKPEFLILPITVGAIFSAFDSRRLKSRDIIYKSALKGTVSTVISQLLLLTYYYGFTFNTLAWFEPLLTLAGGAITAVAVNGLSPIMINLFKFTTDIVYMELINLNHPLLRKLVLKAPGTYSHSVMVATLAEAAAEAIGANALLAKAGGLFHDIGKLKNPQAFVENQLDGVNIHDKLPPEKSAAILRSHIEYGEEIGRKYGLPERIIDIIKQHHGTKLMKYFYHKAKELYGDKVDEKIYRYPGPKPQFKESGLVMLADTVEAATRSMKDKQFDLDSFIHKLIWETVEEGQLNQSGLSLKEIELTEKVFKKVLSGIYHNRIEYPEDDKDSKGSA